MTLKPSLSLSATLNFDWQRRCSYAPVGVAGESIDLAIQ